MTSIRRAARLGAAALLTTALVACGSEEPTGSEGSEGSASGEQSGDESAERATTEATAAAAWLAGELEDGLLSYKSQYGPFTDHGMSIDAAVALARIGGHDEAVTSVADAVEGTLPSYTEFPSGKGTHVSAGGTAKALVLAQVAGADPADYAGTDLVADLEEMVGESGRIEDSFPAGNTEDADYSNVIGQVFAARGLSEAGSPEAEAAVDHLLDQQCADGWFRLDLGPAGSPDQACDDAPKAQPDVDATALAAVHLAPAAAQDDDVRVAVEDALDWLADQQGDDGAVVAGPAEANANTTGLAGWAFGEAGRDDEARAAAGWVAGVQAGDGPHAGAIAFDTASFERVPGGKIPAAARSQWLLATAQAAPALLWLSS